MNIVQLDLQDRKLVRKYLLFPFDLYKNNPLWVPPFSDDARNELDPGRNPFFEHSEAAFFLALDDKVTVLGRICVLDNRRHNDFHQREVAFFHHFECVEDEAVAAGLFDAAFTWARARGLDTILGPKGFTPLSGQGVLVKGFDVEPAFAAVVNPPYYDAFIKQNGFRKKSESFTGQIPMDFKLPDKVLRVTEMVKKRKGYKVVNFRTKKELKAMLPEFKRLYSSVLVNTDTLGSFPPTSAEIDSIANQLLTFADPSLVKVVQKDDEMIGFILAYPNVNAALRRTKGRLFPFGWLDLFMELRRSPIIDLNGGGILPEHQGMGGNGIILTEMEKVVFGGRFTRAELVQVGEENQNMHRELKSLGITFNKSHRFYIRDL